MAEHDDVVDSEKKDTATIANVPKSSLLAPTAASKSRAAEVKE